MVALTLPSEIWHRIFRNVPPSVFYSVVPRVSKTWLTHQRSALPGNKGKVGISITLVVCRMIPENFLLYLPDLRYPELADTTGLAMVDLVAPMYEFSVTHPGVESCLAPNLDRTVSQPRWNTINAEIAVNDSFFMRRSPHLAEDVLKSTEILVASVLGLPEPNVLASVREICISRDGFQDVATDSQAISNVRRMMRDFRASYVVTSKISREFLQPGDFPGLRTHRAVFITTWEEAAEVARELGEGQHLELHTFQWDLTLEESFHIPDIVREKTVGVTWDAATPFEPFQVFGSFPNLNELGLFPLEKTSYIFSHRPTTPPEISARFGILTEATLSSKAYYTVFHAISFINWPGKVHKCAESGAVLYDGDLTFDSPELLGYVVKDKSPRVDKVVLQLDVGTIPDIPSWLDGWPAAVAYFQKRSDSGWNTLFKHMPGSKYFKIIFTCATGTFHSRVHLDRMAEEIRNTAKRHGRKVLFEFGGKAHLRYYDAGNDIDRYLDGLDEDDNIYDEDDDDGEGDEDN